ncbi:hypothetical protein F4778DRAFT_794657 [Xylariomycetidae sp. FL2044]|nr:hypothetical protein F4778DRAFT_794657 [Xylariomycetidae sp. FL2044]
MDVLVLEEPAALSEAEGGVHPEHLRRHIVHGEEAVVPPVPAPTSRIFRGFPRAPPQFSLNFVMKASGGSSTVRVLRRCGVGTRHLVLHLALRKWWPGINFAQDNNMFRLVVNDTGHEFQGRSSGKGLLSLWTHNLQEMLLCIYISDGYTGPAVHMGAGIQAWEAYAGVSPGSSAAWDPESRSPAFT